MVVKTVCAYEGSDPIVYPRGLPQGGAFCPRLFTLCISPVAWKLKASEGYHLSKPVSSTTTHLYYIDDLKIYASPQRKLSRVFKSTREAMEVIGLQ